MTTDPQAIPTTGRARGIAVTALTIGLIALAGCGSSSSAGSSSGAPATPTVTAPAASTPTSSSSSSSSSSSAPASNSLSLEANREGQLEYNTKSLTAKAGTVKIAFTNMSPLSHNVTIESASGKTLGATPTFQGGTRTLTLQLKAGTYRYYCSVPGHRTAGMEGTLTVK